MKKILFLLGLACGSLLAQKYVLAEINQNNKKESFKNTQAFIQIDSKIIVLMAIVGVIISLVLGIKNQKLAPLDQQ